MTSWCKKRKVKGFLFILLIVLPAFWGFSCDGGSGSSDGSGGCETEPTPTPDPDPTPTPDPDPPPTPTPVVNDTFNGTYSILAVHSGKALDVWEWGTTNGTNIAQFNSWGGDSQIFNITSVDGIWHRITPIIATDQSVETADGSANSGANVQTYNYWGNACQQWRFQREGNDRWRIINRNSELCMEVADLSTEDGANVDQYTCLSDAENQIFTMKPTTVEPVGEGLYVAPSGNDSNPGTFDAPFKSITKAQAVASSGETVYLRGGTYSGFTIAGSDANYNFVHNITKSGITYAAYPGETPVFNFAGTTTAKRVAAFHIAKGVSNVTFIGFHVTGVPVGSQKQSECFRIEGNAKFDRMTCRDNRANGFYFTTNASGSCINCDSYNNIGVGASAGNTDGFGAHCKGSVTFKYCRAWNCSDDGFDCIATYAPVTFDHCWVYNINSTGDGNGFKVGGWGTATPPANVPSHIVRYCLAAKIKNSGFYANHHPGKAADWTHNSAYSCGSDFNMLERVSTTNATDIPGTREVLHYNVAYAGTIISNSNLPYANITNNSWTKSGVAVNANDFQSLDAGQMTRPRKADGSLPSITFMKLTNGSDLSGIGYDQ